MSSSVLSSIFSQHFEEILESDSKLDFMRCHSFDDDIDVTTTIPSRQIYKCYDFETTIYL